MSSDRPPWEESPKTEQESGDMSDEDQLVGAQMAMALGGAAAPFSDPYSSSLQQEMPSQANPNFADALNAQMIIPVLNPALAGMYGMVQGFPTASINIPFGLVQQNTPLLPQFLLQASQAPLDQLQMHQQLLLQQQQMFQNPEESMLTTGVATGFTGVAQLPMQPPPPQFRLAGTLPLQQFPDGMSAPRAVLPELTKKKAKGKSSSDKPKRPLSAYNLFFRDERAKLIAADVVDPNKSQDEESDELVSTNRVSESSSSSSNQGKKKKKPHGKIGFEELGRIIGVKWKAIDPESKKKYDDLAAKEKEKYREEMKVYKSKELELLEQDRARLEATVDESVRKRYLDSQGAANLPKRSRTKEPPPS